MYLSLPVSDLPSTFTKPDVGERRAFYCSCDPNMTFGINTKPLVDVSEHVFINNVLLFTNRLMDLLTLHQKHHFNND